MADKDRLTVALPPATFREPSPPFIAARLMASRHLTSIVLFSFSWATRLIAIEGLSKPEAHIYSEEVEEIFARGLQAYDRERFEQAVVAWEELLEFPSNQRSTAAHLMLSRTLFQISRYEESLTAAKRLQRRYSDTRYMGDARMISGDAHFALGRYLEAAIYYGRILAMPASLELQGSAAERLAGIAANEYLTDDAMGNIRLRVGASRLRDALLYGVGRWYMRLGWEEPARAAFRSYLDSLSSGIFAPLASQQLDNAGLVYDSSVYPSPPTVWLQPSASESNRGRVGVLLPLTGPDRHYGEDLLQGVQLANEKVGMPFEVISEDIGRTFGDLPIEEREASRLLRTARATRRLVEEEHVVGLIGPVFSSTSVAAALVAEGAGVPILVPLAQQSGLDGIGEHVFQLGSAPEVQGGSLAEYACLVLGHQHLVVLAPLTDYGRNFAGAFARVAADNGGEVVLQDWYVPYQTKDFGFFFREVRRVGFELMPLPDPPTIDDSIHVDHAIAETTSIVHELDSVEGHTTPDSSEIFIDTIDAIAVVVESFEDVKTVLPQVEFYRLQTQVLGNDLYNAPEDLREVRRRDRKYFNGTLFVSGSHDAAGVRRDFVDSFRRRFHRDPRYAARGYDAVLLLASAWKQGARSRAEMRERLAGMQWYSGASGAISFATDRRVNGELGLWKIDGTRIRPLAVGDLPDLLPPPLTAEIELPIADVDEVEQTARPGTQAGYDGP